MARSRVMREHESRNQDLSISVLLSRCITHISKHPVHRLTIKVSYCQDGLILHVERYAPPRVQVLVNVRVLIISCKPFRHHIHVCPLHPILRILFPLAYYVGVKTKSRVCHYPIRPDRWWEIQGTWRLTGRWGIIEIWITDWYLVSRRVSLLSFLPSTSSSCLRYITFSTRHHIKFPHTLLSPSLWLGDWRNSKLSSAHVYLRQPDSQPHGEWESLPKALIDDAAQLVKANSIEGMSSIPSHLAPSSFTWIGVGADDRKQEGQYHCKPNSRCPASIFKRMDMRKSKRCWYPDHLYTIHQFESKSITHLSPMYHHHHRLRV